MYIDLLFSTVATHKNRKPSAFFKKKKILFCPRISSFWNHCSKPYPCESCDNNGKLLRWTSGKNRGEKRNLSKQWGRWDPSMRVEFMIHRVWPSCLRTLKIPSLKLLKARKKTKCFPSQNTFYLAVFWKLLSKH